MCCLMRSFQFGDEKENLSLENIFQQLTTRETEEGQVSDPAVQDLHSSDTAAPTAITVEHGEAASSDDKAEKDKDTGGNRS